MSSPRGAAAGYLLFRAGARLALPVDDVAEILPYPALAAAPAASPFVAGIANVSGSALTILRVATLLGLAEPPATIHSHLIRLSGVDPDIALLAQRSESILDRAEVELAPLSDDATYNGCVGAMLVAGDVVVAHLLDTRKLLTEEERRRLAAFALRGQERLAQLEHAG